jgi:hypothetical protein
MYLSIRSLLSFVFAFAVGVGAAGATTGPPTAPSTDAPPIKNGASSVHAADLNGDGNVDVISASAGDGEIAWYPNVDRKQNFPRKKVITIGAASAQEITTSDLDGDDDEDLIGAFGVTGKIAWYENDGSGSFSSQKIITEEAAGAVSVHAVDLNGDGHKDVLSASRIDGKIAYYTNDGEGNFSDQKVISNEGEGARSVFAADLDGDGMKDVVYASSVRAGGSKIAWHRNTGDGFADQKIITNKIRGARSVHAADLDADGDMDLLAGFSELGLDIGQLAWFENTGGGSFSDSQVISSGVRGVNAVSTADLDDDGDQDILATSSVSGADGEIAYVLSTAGTFASKSVIATNLSQAQSIATADLDGGGTPDVVGASHHGDKIAWYRNSLLQGFGFSDPKLIAD